LNPLEYMEKNKKNMINDLRTVVEFETPSYNKKLLDKFVDFISGYLEENLKCVPEIIKSDNTGNDIKCTLGSGKKILLLTHYDTVFSEGTLKERPFRIEGEKAYGPGIFDMKAGIIQTLYALKYIVEHSEFNRQIVLLMTSDEEIESGFSKDIIIENARDAEYVLVMEPSLNGKLKTERMGVGTVKLTVHGKSSHAGLDPEKGVNAIIEAANIIMEVKKSGIAGINFDVIRGGTRSNVIPDLCIAEADLRFRSERMVSDIKNLIENIKPVNPLAKIETEYNIRPPMIKTLKSQELFMRAREIAHEKLNMNLEETSVAGGSDGNFCSYYAPVLDGLGAVGDGAHSENEFIYINSMPERAALLYYLINDL
jgi:glutamate carboxypeptidase